MKKNKLIQGFQKVPYDEKEMADRILETIIKNCGGYSTENFERVLSILSSMIMLFVSAHVVAEYHKDLFDGLHECFIKTYEANKEVMK
jgi:hypothetical protein